jgi:hypothetical protein
MNTISEIQELVVEALSEQDVIFKNNKQKNRIVVTTESEAEFEIIIKPIVSKKKYIGMIDGRDNNKIKVYDLNDNPGKKLKKARNNCYMELDYNCLIEEHDDIDMLSAYYIGANKKEVQETLQKLLIENKERFE